MAGIQQVYPWILTAFFLGGFLSGTVLARDHHSPSSPPSESRPPRTSPGPPPGSRTTTRPPPGNQPSTSLSGSSNPTRTTLSPSTDGSVCTELVAELEVANYFSSPGDFPNDYPDFFNGCWRISSDTIGAQVHLQVVYSAVEALHGLGCTWADYLEVRDGGSRHSPLLMRWCGYGTPDVTFKSTGSQLTVVFRTDYSIHVGGFQMRYFGWGEDSDTLVDGNDISPTQRSEQGELEEEYDEIMQGPGGDDDDDDDDSDWWRGRAEHSDLWFSSHHMSDGAIAGCVVAGVVFFILVGLVIYCTAEKYARQKRASRGCRTNGNESAGTNASMAPVNFWGATSMGVMTASVPPEKAVGYKAGAYDAPEVVIPEPCFAPPSYSLHDTNAYDNAALDSDATYQSLQVPARGHLQPIAEDQSLHPLGRPIHSTLPPIPSQQNTASAPQENVDDAPPPYNA